MVFNRHPQLLAAITAITVLLLSPVHDSAGKSAPLASHFARPQPAASQAKSARTSSVLLQVIDRQGQDVSKIVDGNQVRLRAHLDNRSARSQVVRFAIAADY